MVCCGVTSEMCWFSVEEHKELITPRHRCSNPFDAVLNNQESSNRVQLSSKGAAKQSPDEGSGGI